MNVRRVSAKNEAEHRKRLKSEADGKHDMKVPDHRQTSENGLSEGFVGPQCGSKHEGKELPQKNHDVIQPDDGEQVDDEALNTQNPSVSFSKCVTSLELGFLSRA